jgi:hypothetical protein
VQSAVARHSRRRGSSRGVSLPSPSSESEGDQLHEEVWQQLCQQGVRGTEREAQTESSVEGSGRGALTAVHAGVPTGMQTPAVSAGVLGPRSANTEPSGVSNTPAVIHSSSRSRAAGECGAVTASTAASGVCVTSPSPSDATQRANNKENNPQATVGSSATASISTSISTSKSTERLLSSQAARIALLAATAMTAKRKASGALADDQNLRAVRQPLRTLQTLTQTSHVLNQIPERVSSEDTKKIRKPESRDQSPDKQDPRSALEKRIGAMR